MTLAAHIARALAIMIAVLGVIDPALTGNREGNPDVALVTRTERDSTVARILRERLGADYNLIDGQWDDAAATIVVGNSLPDRVPKGMVFAVRDTGLAIESFAVPAVVPSEARIPIRVKARNGSVELLANSAVMDANATGQGELTLTPWAPGVIALQARAMTGSDTTSVYAVTNVVDRSHPVLFFDRRPSWMSTFVRRSLEADRRFTVASRVVTSRGISSASGSAPSTLADPSLLELYDVIVVGAPTLLSASDVAGLEQFLRRRGGAVVLLYDEPPTRGAHDRLTGVTRWTSRTGVIPSETRDLLLKVTEFSVPSSIPVSHQTLLHAPNADSASALVWSTGMGPGQLIASGALDAWKYRDRATSGFDEFWRATISRAAREAADAVMIDATPNLAEPGERVTVKITVRDTLARPEVRIDSTLVQVWPGERAGEFIGHLRAPAIGDYVIGAVAGAARASAPILVREGVARVINPEENTVAFVTRASGGMIGPVDSVAQAVQSRVFRESRMERWWPMRSAWWILPFGALLGFEWLLRRRKGLA